VSAEHELTSPLAGREGLLLRLAQRVLGRLRAGSMSVTFPDGQRLEFAGSAPGPHGDIAIRSFHLLRKLLVHGDVGFGEAYVDGDWESPNLAALLEMLLLNEEAWADIGVGGWQQRLLRALVHRLRRNSRRGSRRNIAYHYDLGNDFYRLWLDETWTYSGAIFPRENDGLADAQRHKFRLMLERLDLRPEHHLLEIGSGWGGFAMFAAKETGCRVTSITLSQEQLDEAHRRAAEEGLADRVQFRLQDYRDVRECFDRVVSIEMYEAVGERYWPEYFASLHRCLKPGGRAAIQGIVIDHAIFDFYRRNVDFIQKYIFPGGMLASSQVFFERAEQAGLAVAEPRYYGAGYAVTLREWQRNVWQARERIAQMFDERFLRMWRYYLAYCEAGFRAGRIDLMQVTLIRPG
jgi:cyclopropane-fatty-acyl-phospholipid synthase